MKKRTAAFILTLIMILSMCGCIAKSAEPVVAEGLPEFTVHGETDLPGYIKDTVYNIPGYPDGSSVPIWNVFLL